VTLIMEATGSCETSVLVTAIRRNIPEDGILQVTVRCYNYFIGPHKVLAFSPFIYEYDGPTIQTSCLGSRIYDSVALCPEE
jgi:hypothetical protein